MIVTVERGAARALPRCTGRDRADIGLWAAGQPDLRRAADAARALPGARRAPGRARPVTSVGWWIRRGYPSREWRMIGLRLPGRRFTRTAGFFPGFAFDFLLDELGFFTAAPPRGPEYRDRILLPTSRASHAGARPAPHHRRGVSRTDIRAITGRASREHAPRRAPAWRSSPLPLQLVRAPRAAARGPGIGRSLTLATDRGGPQGASPAPAGPSSDLPLSQGLASCCPITRGYRTRPFPAPGLAPSGFT
jgi:hypothetical protein